jgi:hypothetical protein
MWRERHAKCNSNCPNSIRHPGTFDRERRAAGLLLLEAARRPAMSVGRPGSFAGAFFSGASLSSRPGPVIWSRRARTSYDGTRYRIVVSSDLCPNCCTVRTSKPVRIRRLSRSRGYSRRRAGTRRQSLATFPKFKILKLGIAEVFNRQFLRSTITITYSLPA